MAAGPQGMPPGLAQRKSAGSGFIIDSQGCILTTASVVQGAETVEATLDDERRWICAGRAMRTGTSLEK
ncbi:MAG: hypothetical protein IT210_18330 [Armatimonadetes bacterium]|nr:hypothetical protein [Armatimonadota bacterium]